MPTTAEYLNELAQQKKALADNISSCGVTADENETFNTLVPKVDSVYEAGKSNTIDTLTNNGTYFGYLFCSKDWLKEVPLWDSSKSWSFGATFQRCTNITSLPPYDYSSGLDFGYMCCDCAKLQQVPYLWSSKGTNFNGVFSGCTALETIGEIDLSSATAVNNAFTGCTKLTFLYFAGNIKISGLDLSQSTLLSQDSLMSAIRALYNHSSSTSTHTLTLGTTNLDKLTDEEKAIATDKGWTLA